jgi:peptide/nickel transport system permease protein
MSEAALAVAVPPRPATRARHPWRAPGLVLPLVAVLLLLAVALAPGLLTATAPDAVDLAALLQPPGAAHWFGTDQLGRDVFARVVHGSSQSLTIGLGATLIAVLGGTLLGTLAALAPARPGAALTRVIDVLLAFPELLLALLVIAVIGRGPGNTLLAVGLAGVAGYARLVRAQVLQLRLSGYVEHAVALGESPATIFLRHILPNAVRPLLVLATVGVGHAILAASSLSFLGLGVVPPAAEWGALLAEGRDFLDIAPWISLLPATVVAASVIAITLLGRRLQTLLAHGDTP